MVFFAVPLISAAVLSSAVGEPAPVSGPSAPWADSGEPWTPVPMDATSDGTIIVRKVAYPRDTAQTFTFTGDVAGTIPSGGTLTVTDLPVPGTYTSTEIVPSGWSLQSIQCDDGSHFWSNTATFDFAVAQSLQCTFYDIEQGSEPCQELTGRWPYGPSHALDVDGATVFMGSGSALVSVDASAPSNPFELDAFDLEQVVRGVEVVGNHVFVTTAIGYDGSLVILDATNPADLQRVGDVYVPDPKGLEVAGSYAYIASGGWDLAVVDIVDLSSPTVVTYLYLPGNAVDVSLSGSLAIVATGYDGIRTVDVTSPSAPVEVGSLDLGQYSHAVDVVGLYAYVATDSDGLTIINIGDPAHPLVAGSFDTLDALGVHVDGTLAYVADSWWGLKVVDVSNPTSPALVGNAPFVGMSEQVVVGGGYAFISANRSDLQIIDVTPPSSPTPVGALDFPNEAYDVDLIGDYAYLSLGYEGDILVLDVSDPAAPQQATYLDTSWGAESLQPAGSYAYLAAGDGGLRILDVSDPAAPVDIGGVNTPGWGTDVALVGDHAYLADGWSGLRVIDVSVPSAPFEVGSATTASAAVAVVADGGYAYVATQSDGIWVFDVAEPAAPLQLNPIDPLGSERALALRDSNLFAAGTRGVRVIDVTDPRTPHEIGFYDAYVNATDIALLGHLAYVATYSYGYSEYLVYDVSDPTSPIMIDRVGIVSGPTALAVGRERVLVTQTEAELEIHSPCGLLMADDFETGDTRIWSAAVRGR
jgi:hypothetical protein